MAGEATKLLNETNLKNPAVAERLFSVVYDELHALAGRYFHHQPANHTLQPTALVN